MRQLAIRLIFQGQGKPPCDELSTYLLLKYSVPVDMLPDKREIYKAGVAETPNVLEVSSKPEVVEREILPFRIFVTGANLILQKVPIANMIHSLP